MSRRKTESHLPDRCLQVTTYRELAQYVKGFADGSFSFLIILGSPGLGKSETIRRTLEGKDHLFIGTHATPLGMYQALYAHRDQPVVIDDLDCLCSDRGAVRLLKGVCNSDPIKRVCWRSNNSAIGDEEGKTPAEFETTSRICVITNEWVTTSENVRALEDRGIMLHFAPSPLEIHQMVSGWFDDDEVLAFIGDNLHLMPQPSIRLYQHGKELKGTEVDWRPAILALGQVDKKFRAIAELQADASFVKEEDRVKAFMRLGHSRSTYFDRKKKMPPRFVLPAVVEKPPIAEAAPVVVKKAPVAQTAPVASHKGYIALEVT
jgi:hypothetical protein